MRSITGIRRPFRIYRRQIYAISSRCERIPSDDLANASDRGVEASPYTFEQSFKEGVFETSRAERHHLIAADVFGMSIDISQLVLEWDRDYEANLLPQDPQEKRQPYAKLLEALYRIADLRFQPYQNDDLPSFIEKLRLWLKQFPDKDKRAAFLLANRIVFISQRQFESLQRRLYTYCIKRHLLDSIISTRGLMKYDYKSACSHLAAEMDATIFVPNSDSSNLNSFVHKNSQYFQNREARHLVGPELRFWTYPAERARHTSVDVANAAKEFERKVLASDPVLLNKTRMVIIEDFSGSGSDLIKSLMLLEQSALPLKEIIIAPVLATEISFKRVTSLCQKLPTRNYRIMTADVLPEKLCCFDGRGSSYLDGHDPVPNLSTLVKQLSEEIYAQHFAGGTFNPAHRHGVGKLALAFVMFSNCPDNSLPIIWKQTNTWSHALFQRVSRIV
jgi:hypothetical protein